MTSKQKQFRAVVLAALMVLSVFAGTVAFTGTAAATASDAHINGETGTVTIDEGTNSININATTSGTTTTFFVADDNNQFNPNNEYVVNDSGNTEVTATLDVSNLDVGTYTIGVTENDTALSGGDSAEDSVELVVDDNNDPELNSAIHYDNGTSSSAEPELELAFSEPVTVNDIVITTTDDDDATVSTMDITSTDGRVLVTLSEVNTSELEVQYNVTDDAGNTVDTTTDDDDAEDVTFAATTVKESDKNAYKGANVAIVSNSTNSDVELEGEDNYAFSGSTGDNSKVFVFKTSNRALGEYNATFDEATRTIDLRDLGLSLDVDDLNITTDDAVEGTVSANAGTRPVTLQLYDSSDDEFGAEDSASLNGQGEYEFDLDEFSDSDDGEYTLEVRDDYTGVTVESSTIVVEEGSDGKAGFGSSVVTEQRGDVAEIPITLSNSDTATVNIGSEDVGFLANVTVEDDNDDGEVVLLFNTWDAQGSDVTSAFSTDDDDDEVTNVQIDSDNTVSSLLDAGDYDLEVRAGSDPSVNSDNVATLVLEERSTDSVQTWTASDDTDLGDVDEVYEAAENANLTQDSEIAEGDLVVAQISASGLGGLYEAEEEAMFFDSDKVHFSVNQTEAGANRDPFWLNLTSDNVKGVVGDAENDTYFVVFDSDNDDIDAIRSVGGDSVNYGADETFTANFTVLEDDGNLSDDDQTVETDYDLIEGEHSIDDPYNVSNAAGQIVEGDSDVAPGTELQIRVRSDSDTKPSFLKTASVYVTENNTFSAEFDFSEQNVGDTFTVKVSGSNAADDETVDGNVVEGSNTTETVTDDGTATVTDEPVTTDAPDTTEAPGTTEAPATDEPATEEPTDTSTPGFGVVVALTALLAAALLAVRRD